MTIDDIFLMFTPNIGCVYSLEPPYRGFLRVSTTNVFKLKLEQIVYSLKKAGFPGYSLQVCVNVMQVCTLPITLKSYFMGSY